MSVITKIPRHERTRLRGLVRSGKLPLRFVGPKQFDGYASRSGYFFTTEHNGQVVMLSKNPVRTRDEARSAEALRRFGRKASQQKTK